MGSQTLSTASLVTEAGSGLFDPEASVIEISELSHETGFKLHALIGPRRNETCQPIVCAVNQQSPTFLL